MGEGRERPIAFTLRTLAPAERDYLQLEKEGEALALRIKKFHQYLCGQLFRVYTEHKPLVGTFKCDKAVSTMASSQIQRWALFLSGYQYDLVHREGKKNSNADCLSRLQLTDTTTNVPIPGDTVMLMNCLEASLIKSLYLFGNLLSQVLVITEKSDTSREPGSLFGSMFYSQI